MGFKRGYISSGSYIYKSRNLLWALKTSTVVDGKLIYKSRNLLWALKLRDGLVEHKSTKVEIYYGL